VVANAIPVAVSGPAVAVKQKVDVFKKAPIRSFAHNRLFAGCPF
jgi:hypothetical protein